MIDRDPTRDGAATADPQHHAKDAPAPHPGGGVRVLEYYLRTRGATADRGVVAQVIHNFPADQSRMIGLLHKFFGNAYVQDVVAAMQRAPEAANAVRRSRWCR